MTDAAGRGPDQLEELIAARVAQLTAKLQAHEQDLLNQNILFNAALTNMSQGLVMFDAQGRVVICNQRYLDMYGLTPAQVHPGSTIVEVLRHRLASGSAIQTSTPGKFLAAFPVRAPASALSSCPTDAPSQSQTNQRPPAVGLRHTRTSPSGGAPKSRSPIWRATTR